MSNLRLLLKANLISSLGINNIKVSDKKEKNKYIGTALLIIFTIIVLIISIFKMLLELSDMLIMANQMEMLLVGGMFAALVSSFTISLYKAPGYLYQSKDFEMLSALPIKNSTILMSKITQLIISNYLYVIPCMLIPSIVYYMKIDVEITFLINLFMMFFTLPFIPITLASIISYFTGSLASKAKNKNTFLALGTFAVVFLIMAISFNIDDIIVNILENSSSIEEFVKAIYPPSYYYMDALLNNNFTSLLIFEIISILAISLFIMIFSKSFKTINSRMNESYKVENYKVRTLKQDSVIGSLLKKEFKRYTNSYIYLFNTSFGVLLILGLAAVILVLEPDTLASILKVPMQEDMLTMQISLMVLGGVVLSCTTNVSISLEGNNLWIIKSLPIDERDIFKAKILLNFLIVVPLSLVGLTLISLKLDFSLFYGTMMGLAIIVGSIFIAQAGLLINLIYPKLNFVNDTEIVKRSAATLVSIVVQIGYLLLYYGVIMAIGIDKLDIAVMSVVVITLIVNIILFRVINTKGVELFRKIS